MHSQPGFSCKRMQQSTPTITYTVFGFVHWYLWAHLWAHFGHTNVWAHLWSHVWAYLWSHVWAHLWSHLWSHVWSHLWSQNLGTMLWAQSFWRNTSGQWWKIVFELQFKYTASFNYHTFCMHMAHYGQIHIFHQFGVLGVNCANTSTASSMQDRRGVRRHVLSTLWIREKPKLEYCNIRFIWFTFKT